MIYIIREQTFTFLFMKNAADFVSLDEHIGVDFR